MTVVRERSDGDAMEPVASRRRVRVIACGMLAREARHVLAQPGLEHVELRCLPARWHFAPDLIAEGVREAVLAAHDAGIDDVLVGYADCGTGGMLDRVCEELGVSRLPGPHCFAFYQGVERAAERLDADLTSFFVTDFLARQPDAFLWRPLGLDRHPELAGMYFGAYERVVYLAQTDDAALTASAREIAARLGLAFEIRHTGYGELRTELERFGAGLDRGRA